MCDALISSPGSLIRPTADFWSCVLGDCCPSLLLCAISKSRVSAAPSSATPACPSCSGPAPKVVSRPLLPRRLPPVPAVLGQLQKSCLGRSFRPIVRPTFIVPFYTRVFGGSFFPFIPLKAGVPPCRRRFFAVLLFVSFSATAGW